MKKTKKKGNVRIQGPKIWVCMACGKRSRDRHGTHALNKGWDVSCAMNAELCLESKLIVNEHGVVTEVKKGGLIGIIKWAK